MKVLIPGSFDPPANGHIDVISRCAKVFDEVLVGVVVNPSKKSLLSTETRELMLNEIFSETGNIIIKTFKGLLVDFAKDNDVKAIVKGLRAMTDFDYELAQMNSNLADFQTIFIPASPEYGYVSSSMVKEIDSYGGDISKLVPQNVLKRMQDDR